MTATDPAGADPDASDRLIEAGHRLEDAGDIAGALLKYQAVVAAAPSFLRGYLNLGNALQRLGRTTEAIAALESALRIDPELRAMPFQPRQRPRRRRRPCGRGARVPRGAAIGTGDDRCGHRAGQRARGTAATAGGRAAAAAGAGRRAGLCAGRVQPGAAAPEARRIRRSGAMAAPLRGCGPGVPDGLRGAGRPDAQRRPRPRGGALVSAGAGGGPPFAGGVERAAAFLQQSRRLERATGSGGTPALRRDIRRSCVGTRRGPWPSPHERANPRRLSLGRLHPAPGGAVPAPRPHAPRPRAVRAVLLFEQRQGRPA